MRRGDVVVVVMAGDLGKLRPVIIVQADELGDQTTTIIVCPMSSETVDAKSLRPIVKPSEANGLRLPSQIMADKLVTVKRTRVRSVVGCLEPDDLEALERALLVILGLAH